MTIQVINGVQFAAHYSLRPTQLAWFLGSGASASAGIPTGYAMITDFKKRLFCHLSGAKLQDVDASDSIWVDRINQFFKARAVLAAAVVHRRSDKNGYTCVPPSGPGVSSHHTTSPVRIHDKF